jgi:hypothetical protein
LNALSPFAIRSFDISSFYLLLIKGLRVKNSLVSVCQYFKMLSINPKLSTKFFGDVLLIFVFIEKGLNVSYVFRAENRVFLCTFILIRTLFFFIDRIQTIFGGAE